MMGSISSKSSKSSKIGKGNSSEGTNKGGTQPPIGDQCRPTSGFCASTAHDIEVAAGTTGAVVAICASTTITTDTAILIEQSQITLCCEVADAAQCIVRSTGSDNNLDVFGDSFTLRDITFEDGVGEVIFGGNVAIDGNGDHLIQGVEFRNGRAAQVGGNLFVQTAGTLTVEDSLFLEGRAGEAGGGMYILNARAVTLRNNVFQSNSAGQTGGALFSILGPDAFQTYSQLLIIDNTDFEGNTAEIGGGLFITDLGETPTVTILNSDLTSNVGTNAGGAGAIAQFLDGINLTITDSRSNNNRSPVCPNIVGFFSGSETPFCIDVNEDFLSGGTVPTAPTVPAAPTPASPTPAPATPTPPAVDCVPTAGACVSTAADIETGAATASAVVAICAPSTITTNAAISIAQNSVTICCASTDASQCVLQSSGTDSVMEVTGDSITLRDLSFLDGSADSVFGGNVAISGDGSHIISGCIFRNGQASQAGGNLFIDTKDSVLIEGSTFANGEAGRNGGGLYVENARTVTLKDSSFESNSAPGGTGGGFFSVLETPTDFGQAIVIDNTDFNSNTAAIGGGFFVTQLGTLPTLTILNSEFSSNVGTDAAGAGAIAESLNNLILVIAGGSGSANQSPVCADILVRA